MAHIQAQTSRQRFKTQLGADYMVSYNDSTRKFSITNNTVGVVAINWSNPLSTAAGVLGFDNVDPVVSSGAADVSDYDAACSLTAPECQIQSYNRRTLLIRLSDALTTQDTFQIKDLSIFEMLTNLKNAIDAEDTTWVSNNAQYFEDAKALIRVCSFELENQVGKIDGPVTGSILGDRKCYLGNHSGGIVDHAHRRGSHLDVRFSLMPQL